MKKMNIGIIIGVLVMLLGLTMILNIIFHVHIPFFKIAIALFFIWIGVRMLTGSFGCKRNIYCTNNNSNNNSNSVIFGSNNFTYKPGEINKFNVVFGNATLDLTHVPDTILTNEEIEVNTVFGETKIILPDSIPVTVNADAAFGEVRLPNQATATFGSAVFKTPVFDHSRPELTLKVSTVFGSTKVNVVNQ
jgi:predicted membrane protein